MTLPDMTDLIILHDAVSELEEVANKLTGIVGFAFSDGIMGKLERVESIIERNSKLFDPKKDYAVQEHSQILNDSSRPAEERARLLMGMDAEDTVK